MYYHHTHCRACGYGGATVPNGIKAQATPEKLVSVLNLGVQPLANDFCGPNEERAGYAPLEVMLCPRCELAQLSVVVRPEILYSRYAYQTSASKTMDNHFRDFFHEISIFLGHKPIQNVIEIGSNDGLFLDHCRQFRKVEQLFGIEPAANLAEIARAKKITTINSMFNREVADQVLRAVPEPDLIVARHVFCHIDDWTTFIADLGSMMAKNTLAAIEIPYVPDMLATGSFDQVYHEHLSYLNLRSMKYLLAGTPLELAGVRRFAVHGGVVVLFIRRHDSDIATDPTILSVVASEKCGLADWQKFADHSHDQICALRGMVHDLIGEGKRVCGLGASAKATVWINACGFTRKEISYVMDCTPTKVYKQIPGTDIPIVHEGTHVLDAPEYCVLFAWNYKIEVLAREKQYQELGGKFIVPIPEPEILGSECGCKTGCAGPNVTA